VSGAVAAHVQTTSDRPAVTVRLASPPPLDRVLTVQSEPTGDDGVPVVRLLDGERLVATAGSAPAADAALGDVDAPPATYEEAAAAEKRYEGLADHPFPTCFACGTERDPGDALCLRPGPLDDGTGRHACRWQVPDGVDAPQVWAALDCPGGWSAGVAGRPMVLGTMTALVHTLPEPGTTCIVTAWQTGAQGRRHWSATTVHSPDGRLVARAAAVWIAVDPATIRPTSHH
jgi:hypothetical protein